MPSGLDIVTSNYHTRRAGNIFRSKAHDLEFHIVAAPDRDFTPDGWWKNREGRKILRDRMDEDRRDLDRPVKKIFQTAGPYLWRYRRGLSAGNGLRWP